MTILAPSFFRKYCPNFKGKQRTHYLSCGCCYIINNKREKKEKEILKEIKKENNVHFS